MADKIVALVSEPRDEDLPIDVQGVNLRHKAIELMQEIANIKKSTVRYRGATDAAVVDFGPDVGLVTLWQRNLMAARFDADGTVLKEVCGTVSKTEGRNFYAVSFERDATDLGE
ncbi:hypothetical protein SHEEN_45 [Mycobacterium phage Sheen]|uniref:Uncharacterized protein n=1 Tax=Mycobacterium phage Sheen TaxID=1589274 RepID=A0A0B5A0W4_9CAUD|nr:hypothetical protein AVV31_gp49 [Mycobacterium phage Sheen]AJD82463.1 hypothetical protein SHEEN_45 [Mycobacterium phage Sheen]